MCGRFTLVHNLQTIAQTFQAQIPPSLQTAPRYNIAPSQNVISVMRDQTTHLASLRWGLIPSWATDAQIGNRMINARAETLAEKASFRRLLASRRCLIVADGFYEWKQDVGVRSKTPMYITLRGDQPFAFAGLWDSWVDQDGVSLRTCTIITTQPNQLLATIHNRMPVILPSEAHKLWLDPSVRDADVLTSLLVPFPTDLMQARPVSRLVNDPKQDYAALIA